MNTEKRFQDYNDFMEDMFKVKGDKTDFVKAHVDPDLAMYISNNSTLGAYAKHILPCPNVAEDIERIFFEESLMMAILMRNNKSNFLMDSGLKAISARLGTEGDMNIQKKQGTLSKIWSGVTGRGGGAE